MNLATRITASRLLAAPVFVALVLATGADLLAPHRETLRWCAAALFLLACLTDALDGWVARRYHQQTPFGAALDAVADKVLLLSGMAALLLAPWPSPLPPELPIAVLWRDLVAVLGGLWLHHRHGRIEIHPTLAGKFSTVLQMLAIGHILLQVPSPDPRWVAFPAGLLAVAAGLQYLRSGLQQHRRLSQENSPHAEPAPPRPRPLVHH